MAVSCVSLSVTEAALESAKSC